MWAKDECRVFPCNNPPKIRVTAPITLSPIGVTSNTNLPNIKCQTTVKNTSNLC